MIESHHGAVVHDILLVNQVKLHLFDVPEVSLVKRPTPLRRGIHIVFHVVYDIVCVYGKHEQN